MIQDSFGPSDAGGPATSLVAAAAAASLEAAGETLAAAVGSQVGALMDGQSMRWVPQTELVGTPFNAPSPAAMLRKHVLNDGYALLAKNAVSL